MQYENIVNSPFPLVDSSSGEVAGVAPASPAIPNTLPNFRDQSWTTPPRVSRILEIKKPASILLSACKRWRQRQQNGLPSQRNPQTLQLQLQLQHPKSPTLQQQRLSALLSRSSPLSSLRSATLQKRHVRNGRSGSRLLHTGPKTASLLGRSRQAKRTPASFLLMFRIKLGIVSLEQPPSVLQSCQVLHKQRQSLSKACLFMNQSVARDGLRMPKDSSLPSIRPWLGEARRCYCIAIENGAGRTQLTAITIQEIATREQQFPTGWDAT